MNVLRLPEKKFEQFECASSTDAHFLVNPIKLDCGHCICKDCVLSSELVICVFCGLITSIALDNNTINVTQSLANVLDELFMETKERFSRSHKALIQLIGLFFIF